MIPRFAVPELLLLAGFSILTARPVAADGKEKAAVTRPVISEEVAPLQAIAPVAKDKHRGEAYLRKPPGDGPFPAAVLVHGGMGPMPTSTLREYVLGTWTSRFLAAGYVVVQTTYRSRMEDPQTRDSLEDVLATLEHVRKLPYVDAKSIVVTGTSGGGDLALSVAVETDVAVVAAEEPASVFFTGLFNKGLAKAGERYMPRDVAHFSLDPERFYTAEYQKLTRDKVAKIRCPILIIQGDQHRVNNFNAKVLLPELKAAKKTLEVITYKGMPHSFAFYSGPLGVRSNRSPYPDVARKAFEDVDGYVRKQLKTKPTPIDLKLVKQVPIETE